MITIKEYSQRAGISEQAARATVNRYPEELAGHIHTQGRTRYLDDEAVAFLEQHRLPRSVVMLGENAQLMEIERLKAENEELIKKLMQAQERVMTLQERLLEAEPKVALLTAAQSEAEQAQSIIKQLEAEKAELAAKVEKKGFLGWLHKFRK